MKGLHKLYHAKCKESGFIPDIGQNLLVEALEHFRLHHLDPRQSLWTRWMAKIWTPHRSFNPTLSYPLGLYIWGPPGRGKTFIMDLFIQSIPKTFPHKRAHFLEFMTDVHKRLATFHNTPQQPIQMLAAEISQKVRLLCFDEFQVTNIADAMILSRLFKELFMLGVRVIFTSNVSPQDLYKEGLMRERFTPFIDILQKTIQIFPMNAGQDYRYLPKHIDYYYWPISDETKSTLKALFKKCGLADFANMCAQPKGSEDYREFGTNHPTILLINVPQMTDDQINEMLRFMTMIDVWYEMGVKLVVEGDCPLTNLYPTDAPHAQDFKRTLSRISQMTGQTWHLN